MPEWQLPLFSTDDDIPLLHVIITYAKDSVTAATADGWYMAIGETKQDALELLKKRIEKELEYRSY